MAESISSIPPTERQTQAQGPLKVVEPQTLLNRLDELNSAIALRAYELFQSGGKANGHDVIHWLQAESELLHPAHMHVLESGSAVTVQAEVPGFSVNELQVSLEPRRVTINGKRDSSAESKSGQTIYQEQCSREILRVVDLPAEVNAAKATATLRNGILELTMPKVAEAKSTPEQAKAATSGA